jgi:hypothetical protein
MGAKTAGVNRGAVERQKKLRDNRPDLAAKVRAGDLKPTEARRTMKRDAIIEKALTAPPSRTRSLTAAIGTTPARSLA